MIDLALLWVCIGLFLVRVIGQIEVLLISPAWLPPMSAWYSGLLPYYLLLPCQIVLLMLMCLMAINAASARSMLRRWSVLLTFCWCFSIVYFAGMVTRLAVVLAHYGSQFYLHGAIPVAFHWVLALFLFVWARRARVTPT